jgi:long-chain acyl-CoA synthetase
LQHPAVACAAILAEHDAAQATEVVKLVAQLSMEYQTTNADTLREDILKFCREKLAPYKIPRIIEFRDTIPLTPIGKVDKKALRAELRKE